MKYFAFYHFSSVVQSCLTLKPHGLQHTRFPCPSQTPRAYSNSCPSSQWCHPTISSSVIHFSSCLQSFLIGITRRSIAAQITEPHPVTLYVWSRDPKFASLSSFQVMLEPKVQLLTDFLFFKFLFIYLFIFYFTILYRFCHTSTCICHGCTCIPHSEPPSHLPTYPIPLGHPSAPAPSFLYPALNLDWQFISYMILYMF